MLLETDMKTCSKCGQTKPLDRFNKHPRTRDGFHGVCKDCRNAQERARFASNPEYAERRRKQQNELARLRYLRDPEKVRARNQAKRRPYTRDAYFSRYGLTEADVVRKTVDQGGVCAICRKPPTDSRGLFVDHNHSTGQVRALLCSRCNQRVGFVEVEPALLQEIIAYLNSWSVEKV
jgi:hypothetical protein